MTVLQLLNKHVTLALSQIGLDHVQAVVRPASRPEFGDYQANGVMNAAKVLKMDPMKLAKQVVGKLDLKGVVHQIDVVKPGFINFHLDTEFLSKQLKVALADPKLGIHLPKPQHIMVEYSSPNIAKEMHVGHLRTTVIGDALTRIFGYLGHHVVRGNHVGDWGTQFGMLIAYLVEIQKAGKQAMELADLEEFYRKAKVRFDEDEAFADVSRDYVTKLQGGQPEILALWQQFVDISLEHCQAVYEKLDVLLTRDDAKGESSYNEDLPTVVEDLEKAGLLAVDAGAKVVYLEEFRNKDGKPLGVIVQKRDGGFLYTATDLAAVRYRHRVLKLDRVLYVVDARQSQHFQQIFRICRKAGFAPPEMVLEHIGFGLVLGSDGKPFKTRSGDTVKMIALLDEAIDRALVIVKQKNPDLSEKEQLKLAHAIGIGAIRYADLSKHRTSDYIFDWDTILAFEGNTSLYIQYAYTRIQSIFRKAGAFSGGGSINLVDPTERRLANHLLQFEDVLHSVVEGCYVHHLCTFLYQLANIFSNFYENCSILKSEPALKNSRLQLLALTARTLKVGMELLGIRVLEAM
ncbi:MAG: arginine--tRNA ligase [Neisseriales bacterium]|nr:MAG: arginine--tRNA ligase [Neisseriales bacterium]